MAVILSLVLLSHVLKTYGISKFLPMTICPEGSLILNYRGERKKFQKTKAANFC